jgi:hypothetical protein
MTFEKIIFLKKEFGKKHGIRDTVLDNIHIIIHSMVQYRNI